VLRLSRLTASHTSDSALHYDGAVIHGHLKNSEVIFKEYGLRFSADVIHGHKTGYFLDHRHNRHQVGLLAKGCRVLDVFSYAGGFSVHALAGGAREVTSLDISKQALEMAKKNVKLNRLTARHKTMAVDAFSGMEQLFNSGTKYELLLQLALLLCCSISVSYSQLAITEMVRSSDNTNLTHEKFELP